MYFCLYSLDWPCPGWSPPYQTCKWFSVIANSVVKMAVTLWRIHTQLHTCTHACTCAQAAKGMAKAAMGKKQEGPPQEQLEEKWHMDGTVVSLMAQCHSSWSLSTHKFRFRLCKLNTFCILWQEHQSLQHREKSLTARAVQICENEPACSFAVPIFWFLPIKHHD